MGQAATHGLIEYRKVSQNCREAGGWGSGMDSTGPFGLSRLHIDWEELVPQLSDNEVVDVGMEDPSSCPEI